MSQKCPTCGSTVGVYTGGEGTSSFIPADRVLEARIAELERERDEAYRALAAAQQLLPLNAELSVEVEKLREGLLGIAHGGGVSGTPENHVHLNDVWSREQMRDVARQLLSEEQETNK